MLINKSKDDNPFGAARTSREESKGPSGIMIDTPQNVPMASEPGMVEQGVGLLKDKALTAGVNKATGAATTAIEGALAGAAPAAATVAGPAGMPVAAQAATAAGKGGAAAAGGAAKAGLMAAAPMAAPLVIGGLLAAKLLK